MSGSYLCNILQRLWSDRHSLYVSHINVRLSVLARPQNTNKTAKYHKTTINCIYIYIRNHKWSPMKKTFYQKIINLIFCQQFLFESFFEKKLVKSPFFFPPSPGKYQPILVSRAWNTHLASLLSLTMCCIWTPSASRFICAWVQFSTCKINSALGEPKPTNSDQTKYFFLHLNQSRVWKQGAKHKVPNQHTQPPACLGSVVMFFVPL